MLFKEVIGQEEIKQRLIHSVKENRVSHAQLFLNAPGSGGLPLALAYATYILCTNRQDTDACGVCSSCLKANKLEHPDMHFAFPVIKERKIETSDDVLAEFRKAVLEHPYMNIAYWVEQLSAESKAPQIFEKEAANILKKLSYKTYEGEYKIMIIWMAEMMNATVANKLLKILEEPPDKTLFILIAENFENILPTILSRTQLHKIQPVSDADMYKWLCDEKGITAEEAGNIISIAEGSIWAAQNILSGAAETLTSMESFRTWMLHCFNKDVSGIMEWIDDLADKGREQQKNFLRYSLHVIRQCIIGTYTQGELLNAHDKEKQFVAKFSKFVHGYNVVPLNEELNKAYYYIERNAYSKLVFLNLSFAVMRLMFPKK
jgi:DNA polymerase-3 subunit delta'